MTVGRPSELTDEVYARLIEAVPLVMIQAQVAAYCKIPKSSLCTWLTRGEKDLENQIDSIYAQFSNDYHKARSQIIRHNLAFLSTCPKNFQAVTWIMEKCFREDFGKESDELRELRSLFIQILPQLTKGALNDGTPITGSDTPQTEYPLDGIRPLDPPSPPSV